jgi:hypothetical protein
MERFQEDTPPVPRVREGLVRYLFGMCQKVAKTSRKRGIDPPRGGPQLVTLQRLETLTKKPQAMCKIGKLSFVAGAEIPKKYCT